MAIRRIEAKAAAQAEAAKPAEASYARVTFLTMRRRTLADALQVALVRLKRGLKNQGMTETQIHEIIPDVPPFVSPRRQRARWAWACPARCGSW